MSRFSVEESQNSKILALQFYILFYNYSSIFPITIHRCFSRDKLFGEF